MKINTSLALLVPIALACAPALAADTPSYEESAAYIQDKGVAETITPNQYYDPAEDHERPASVRSEVHRKIRFPSHCTMELVNEYFREVAPPTGSGLDNHYGMMEREVVTVLLDKVFPSHIYESGGPNDGTSVIIKARKGGITSRSEKFFDQPGNTNLFGVSMQAAEAGSVDSRFGKLECAAGTCTRSRAFNGYGVTPSANEHTIGLRDALIDIAKTCGGTG